MIEAIVKPRTWHRVQPTLDEWSRDEPRITEDHGPVRHVVLNRPEKRNAMSQALLRGARRRAARGRRDESVHCVVLRGDGPRLLRRRRPRRARRVRRRPRRRCAPFATCSWTARTSAKQMPKPVVCQIHRTCVGGALEVALGCDLRIASSDSQLGLPEVKLRDHPRRRRLLAPARGRRARAREGADHDRAHDRRCGGPAHRPGQPRRRRPRSLRRRRRRSWTSCSRTRTSRSVAPSA